MSLPVAFLIGIRKDFFPDLQDFKAIPEPTSTRTTYELQNLDAEQAKQIFSAAAKADAIPFEPTLIDAVVNDLECEGVVRPAELQIVGTRLKRKSIFNVNKYEIAGRASGILSSYIADEIKQSANEQVARLVLRLMTADGVETKSAMDLSLYDIVRGIGDTRATLRGRTEDIQKILNQFVAARILIHTDDDKYNLVHDYLAPYVRAATKDTETDTERANRLLKRYVADYKEDAKARIPLRHVPFVRKHSSREIKAEIKARELLRKSTWDYYWTVVWANILVLFLSAVGFGLITSYYLSTEPERIGSSQRIVVRAGLGKFSSGLGFVAVQTDFTYDDLAESAQVRDAILREEVIRSWFERSEGGYRKWGEDLVTRLSPLSQARAIRWLGQPQRAGKVLAGVVTDSGASSDLRFSAAYALGQLVQLEQINPQDVPREVVQNLSSELLLFRLFPGSSENMVRVLGSLSQISTEIVTPEIAQQLIGIIADTRIDSPSRLYAAEFLGQRGRVNPQVITPELMRALTVIATDTKPFSLFDRGDAVDALVPLGEANPQVITPEVLNMLNSLVSDSQTDPILRYKAADALGQLGEANPRIITPDMIQALMDIVTDNKTRVVLRSSAADALGRLGQANPQAVPSDVIQRLITSISDLNTDFSSQYYAGIALVPIGQANPQRVQSELVEDLMAIVKSPDAPQRFFAVRALGQLGQVSPESVSPETIQALLALMSEKLRSDYYKNVAECLEELAQANPRLVTPDVIGILHSIFNDPQVDSTQRFYAVSTLGELARINPYAATAETTQTMLAIATYRGNNFSIRQDMFNTIGKVRAANPGAMPTDLVPMLLKLLKDDRDSTMRIVGAYGIFFLVLYDPGHEKPIRAELEKLSADSLPHLRMAAARTSEMLTIGNWVQEVRADPNQGAHIKMRLEALKDSPEDHIKFAAEVALEEVAKIEKEKR